MRKNNQENNGQAQIQAKPKYSSEHGTEIWWNGETTTWGDRGRLWCSIYTKYSELGRVQDEQ